MRKTFTLLFVQFAMLLPLCAQQLISLPVVQQPVQTAEVFDCTIEPTDVEAYTAKVLFTPANTNAYYICSVALKSTFESLTESYIFSYFKNTMDNSIDEGSALSYDEFAHQGIYEHTFTKLTPETDYVVFAYTIDINNGTATSSIKSAEFSTTKDVATETDVYLHIVSPHWIDKVETNGWWQITGWTANYDHYVQFCADPVTETTGTFTLTNTTWDWNYTGVYFYPSEGTYPTKRIATEMTVTITEENDVYYFAAEYKDERGVTYHITFDPNGDAANGNTYDMLLDVETSFTAEEGKMEYSLEDGCFYVWYQNEANEYFEAKLYVEDNVLNDGDYEISSSCEENTAEACTSDGTNINGTVYGKLDSEGYMISPWFWCTGGVISVSHDENNVLQLNVDATNSWGKHLKISINEEGTGVDAIQARYSVSNRNGKQAAPRKVFENGRIRIENAGRAWSEAGVEVK